MGNPIRTLAEKWFSGSPLYHEFIRVEKCEYIHIHWRDLRILLTVEQFKSFFNTLETAYKKWNGKLSPDEDILLEIGNLPESIIFEGKGTIEEQHGEIIHFHYGDLRLELQPQTFLMMARLFEQAKKEYNKTRWTLVLLKDIDIYDPGHFDNKEEWLEYDKQHPERIDDYQQHVDGIKLIKKGIHEGRTMRPISIIEENGRYKRLDGFKRCIAWKEVYGDDSMISCYIEEGSVTPGSQDGQSWFLE